MIGRVVMRLAVLGSLGLVVCGCAGTHIYRKPDHDLALKAQASFKDAKLSETMTEERKRLDEMLQKELAASRRQGMATRNAALLAIVGSSNKAWDDLRGMAVSRLEKLVGTGAVEGVITTYNDLDAARGQLGRTADLYRGVRTPTDPVPVCPLPATLSAVSANVKNVFDRYAADCKKYLDLQESLGKVGAANSEWVKLSDQIAAMERNRATYQAELAKVKSAYETNKKTYEDAVKKGDNKALADLEKKVRETLDAVGAPLTDENAATAEKVLKDLGFEDLKLKGLVDALDEKRRALSDLLGPAGNGETGTTTTSSASPASRIIAAAVPSIDAFLKKGRTPPVTALVLEVEHLRLQSESLRRRIANAETRMALLQAKRDAMRGELSWLVRARHSLDTVKTCNPSGDLATDLATGPHSFAPNCREEGLRALVYYANSWALGSVMEDQIAYTLIAARHVAALDASETALAQWENLIGVPISQLVAYHGSGIKPEDIIALLQALGVLGIAVGVN